MVDGIAKGSETILLVDDEPHVLLVSKKMLKALGYTIYTANCGEEAIAVYEERKDEVDLIVLDMIMPGLSGSDTFARIREVNPAVKIILSSGYSLNEDAQAIMEKGCQGFMQKPFNVRNMSAKVREVLES